MNDGERNRIFDPVTTFYCFLNQSISQYSCKQTVLDFNLQRIKVGLKKVSTNTAAYSKAKKRLSLDIIKKITIESGKIIESKNNQWKWKGREVFLVDGTVLDCEDLDEIKSKYPAISYKERQLGFPKIRLLGVFSMATGAFLEGEIGPYSGKGTSEVTLIQKILNRFKPKTVLVLDRFFTNYYLQNLILKNKLDYVIRARDNMAIRNLKNKTSAVIDLERPANSRSANYDFSKAPDTIKIKLIKSSIKRKGFRAACIYLMTSMIDSPNKEIENLYLQRWNVEVDYRNLKCTLNAGVLKSKSADMAEKELFIHLAAYNFIRSLTCLVANIDSSISPRKISFKRTMQTYVSGVKILGLDQIFEILKLLQNEELKSKYRREPRAIKRRQNRYPLLTTTRKKSLKENWGYSRRYGLEKESKNATT